MQLTLRNAIRIRLPLPGRPICYMSENEAVKVEALGPYPLRHELWRPPCARSLMKRSGGSGGSLSRLAGVCAP